MRHILLNFLFIAFFSFSCHAQNDPAPGYLTTRDFPDSVKNLAMATLKGEQMTFASVIEKYKGKKVVVDIWASWCRDCLVGFPKLGTLIENTAHQNISYVFISIDENEQKWKSTITRFSIPGDHYRIPSGWKNTLARYIVLDWVPRYFILNEEGRIIAPKAITSEELEKLLNAETTNTVK